MDILLGNAGNNFGSTVTFVGGSLNDVTVVDLSSLTLNVPTLSGNLSVTANGIDQATVLTIAGSTTLDAGAGDVVLSNAANDFDSDDTGDLLVADGNNLTIRDSDGLTLGAISAITNLTIQVDLGDVNIPLATVITVGGDLILQADGGSIGDTAGNTNGALIIGGDATFNIGLAGQSVTLDNQGNDFAQSVTFNANGGLINLDIYDSSDFEIGTSTVTGNLTIEVGTGDITQTGAITMSATSLATFSAANGDILLGDTGNDFNDVTILAVNGNVSIGEANSVNIDIADAITGSLALDVATDAMLTAGGFALDLGQADVGGNLSIDNVGTLTSSGALTIGGTTFLNAGANNITFDDPNNVFGGVVTVDNSLLPTFANGGLLTFATSSDIALVMTDTLTISNLVVTTPLGATDVSITAPNIVVDSAFGTDDDLSLIAQSPDGLVEDETIMAFGNAGSLSGTTITLYADGTDGANFSIGTPNRPIVITLTDSADLTPTVNLTVNNGRAFGFIRADEFDTAAFQYIFNLSSQRVFIIGRFDEIVSGVQGSFITGASFNVDSSQFRTDLNIFGVEGSGVLLPKDQCEDEESTDCAR